MFSEFSNFLTMVGMLVLAVVVFLLGFWFNRKLARSKQQDTESLTKRMLSDAEKEAEMGSAIDPKDT